LYETQYVGYTILAIAKEINKDIFLITVRFMNFLNNKKKYFVSIL